LGKLDGADHGNIHINGQQHIGSSAVNERQLPPIPRPHKGRGGGGLLFRLAHVKQLRPQSNTSHSADGLFREYNHL